MAITRDQFQGLLDAKKAAEQDNTPFAIMSGDDIYVAGDPNQTETRTKTYTMGFAFPIEMKPHLKNEVIISESENYIAVMREIRGVHINPRHYSSTLSAIVEIQPFLNAVYEDKDGEVVVKDLDEEGIREVLEYMNEEMTEALYHAVATVLRIPQELEEYMLLSDVILAAQKFMVDFPDIINSADSFFGLSAVRKRQETA